MKDVYPHEIVQVNAGGVGMLTSIVFSAAFGVVGGIIRDQHDDLISGMGVTLGGTFIVTYANLWGNTRYGGELFVRLLPNIVPSMVTFSMDFSDLEASI